MTNKSANVKPAPAAKAPGLTKSAPAPRVKVVNESKLKLPQDIGSFTANARRELARSVGRIMVDDKKLQCFLELLDVFKDYATDRHEANVVAMDKTKIMRAAKLKEIEAQKLLDARGVIAGKRGAVAKLEEEIAVHDAKIAKLEENKSND